MALFFGFSLSLSLIFWQKNKKFGNSSKKKKIMHDYNNINKEAKMNSICFPLLLLSIFQGILEFFFLFSLATHACLHTAHANPLILFISRVNLLNFFPSPFILLISLSLSLFSSVLIQSKKWIKKHNKLSNIHFFFFISNKII